MPGAMGLCARWSCHQETRRWGLFCLLWRRFPLCFFAPPPSRPPRPLHPPSSAGARHPTTNPPLHASQHSSSWSDDGHERHAIGNPLRPGKKGCPRPEKELLALRRKAPAPGGEKLPSWFRSTALDYTSAVECPPSGENSPPGESPFGVVRLRARSPRANHRSLRCKTRPQTPRNPETQIQTPKPRPPKPGLRNASKPKVTRQK